MEAFRLCMDSFSWMQRLAGLHVAGQLLQRVERMYTETIGLLGAATQRACADFDAEAYSKAIFKLVMQLQQEQHMMQPR